MVGHRGPDFGAALYSGLRINLFDDSGGCVDIDAKALVGRTRHVSNTSACAPIKDDDSRSDLGFKGRLRP